MMTKRYLAITLLTTIMSVSFFACKKDDTTDPVVNNQGNATINMRLTDGPGDYDAVYLDIQSVEVTMDGQAPVTIVPVRAGIYDILHFRNGLDTLLATATVPAGKISQIRLILGSNNSVVVNGQTHALTTPSGQQSGVKLNLKETFEAGKAYDIWIDFDAGKSIHQTGNGKYMLKPVIRAYSALTDGRIRGIVLPPAALATVYAINGTDTFAAIPAIDGFFLMQGLPQGTYQLWIDATVAPYQDIMINNIQVNYGTEYNAGTINL